MCQVNHFIFIACSCCSSATSSKMALHLKNILKSNGIPDPVSEITFEDAGAQGEGWYGKTEYVTVRFKTTTIEPLHLFVKRKTDNAEYNKVLEQLQSYQKESMFFMEYLLRAREYCKSVGQGTLMNIYPKCYFANDEMIVLENLVLGRGYELLPKEERHDFDTACTALSNLAKHHVISHALIRELGGPDVFFQQFPKLNLEPNSEIGRELKSPSFENAIEINLKILENCWMEGSKQAIATLKSWKGKHFDQFIGTMETAQDDFLLLIHGDYWANNMFRKHKETREIMDHVIIDFQEVKYKSPCIDLGCYLFTTVKHQVRREQFDKLLKVYWKALKTFSNDLGHPIRISLPELEADFSKKFYYGYWFGMDIVTGAGYEVMKDVEVGETRHKLWQR